MDDPGQSNSLDLRRDGVVFLASVHQKGPLGIEVLQAHMEAAFGAVAQRPLDLDGPWARSSGKLKHKVNLRAGLRSVERGMG
jgi:hypothetical protein